MVIGLKTVMMIKLIDHCFIVVTAAADAAVSRVHLEIDISAVC